MKKPTIYKLPSGLNILLHPLKELTTVTILILVKNGADYERKDNNGISHFIEHLVFKGSKRFPGPTILATELDKIGAEYNAFTSYEYTGYYIKTFSEYLAKAIEIISDVVISPIFPKEEIEKERKVILEEINYNEDTPTRLISDLLIKTLYGDQSAGRPILGTKQTIKTLSRDKILNFYQSHYSAKNTTVVVAGDFNSRRALRQVEKYFSGFNHKKSITKPKTKLLVSDSSFLVHTKDVKQGHLILAFNLEGIQTLKEKRFPLGVLTSILGFGFSSRMFKLLRDELGVTYYLNVNLNLFTDRGYLYIQSGCDLNRVEEVMNLIIAETKKLKTEEIDKEELEKAKAVLENHLLMSTETSDSLAYFWGSAFLTDKKLLAPKEIIKKIKAVQSAEVAELAQTYLLPSRTNLAIILAEKPNFAIKKVFNKIQ